MSCSILVESNSVWQLWNPSLSRMTVQYRWWTTPHNVFLFFLFMSMFYLFSLKFFSEMGSGDSDAAALAFKIRACELNISKSNVLLCNIIFGRDECPWIQYWGRHICGREVVWKLCVLIWLPFAFLGGTMGNLMSGQTGACAACTLSSQYQDLKVFLFWTVELLRSSLGWTVDLWNHPLPNRVW